jgi:hypothetical protein
MAKKTKRKFVVLEVDTTLSNRELLRAVKTAVAEIDGVDEVVQVQGNESKQKK